MLSPSGFIIGLIEIGPEKLGPVVTDVKFMICWFYCLKIGERKIPSPS